MSTTIQTNQISTLIFSTRENSLEESTISKFIGLLVLCVTMFTGSFAFGYIPLLITLSTKRLNAIKSLGSGLLVGTALAVIIPEGLHMVLVSTSDSYHRIDSNYNQDYLCWSKDKIPQKMIGASLTLGFMLMLIIDRLFESHHHDVPSFQRLPTNEHSPNPINTSGTFASFGLIFHSAFDGIALGAVSLGQSFSLELIVFFALILHKAPAAFGLTSFLLHLNICSKQIIKHLLVFSFAAPCVAIFTFFIIGMLNSNSNSIEFKNTLGISLLFSSGTFLYIATVHVLPELISKKNFNFNDSTWNWGQILFLVLGLIIPLLLNVEHQH